MTARSRGLERQMSVEEVRALPTTWAKKLGYSGRPRRFCAFEGRALTTGAW